MNCCCASASEMVSGTPLSTAHGSGGHAEEVFPSGVAFSFAPVPLATPEAPACVAEPGRRDGALLADALVTGLPAAARLMNACCCRSRV